MKSYDENLQTYKTSLQKQERNTMKIKGTYKTYKTYYVRIRARVCVFVSRSFYLLFIARAHLYVL